MTISIGSAGNIGPGGALERYGGTDTRGRISGRVLWRLAGFLKPYLHYLGLAAVLMFISSATGLLTPYLAKVAVDNNIATGDMPGLIRTSVIFVITLVIAYVTSAILSYLLAWVGQRVLFSMRSRLFLHLQDLSVAYQDRNIVGVIISRVVNDTGVINDLLTQGGITVLGNSVLLIGTIVAMSAMDLRLALLTFSVIPLMALATWLFSRRARIAYLKTRQKLGEVVGDLAENISGMRVIQAFAQEETTQRSFEVINRANRDVNVSAVSLSYTFLPSVNILSIAAMCIVLGVGGIMVVQGDLTIGVIVAFMAYVNRFFNPIQDLSQLYTTLQTATAGGERVLELLDEQPVVQDHEHATEMPPIQGRIDLDDVSFGYTSEREVLHDINLHIEPGEMVALVGPTGAGKTSIANLIARFYEVKEGAVLIDGHDVRDVTQESLHRQMGLVSQDPLVFAGTITDNIRFGKPDATDEQIVAAAQLANADDFIRNLPDGYDTRILESGANLSVGQRQLICIARAVLVDPRILIMDEATSSVDTLTEALIQEALGRLMSGRTSIVIAHRLSTIRNASCIYVIDDGIIAQQGTHEELLRQGGLYRDLYEKQFITQLD